METLEIQVVGAVARITLNRPESRNAMSDQMMHELLDYFNSIRENWAIRVVVIGATGNTFCSGGDIKDLQADSSLNLDEKIAKMAVLDQMLEAINTAPQVTIARIQGAALGGGFGLVCVTDIAIAGDSARFALPEVRLGLAPALISPYVIARLGLTRTRQLMLTGIRFGAQDALNYGLIHHACADADLDTQVEKYIGDVMECAPNALAETKKLLFHVTSRSLEESLPYRAELISRLRDSAEGQEGMIAFIQKQKPSWAQE